MKFLSKEEFQKVIYDYKNGKDYAFGVILKELDFFIQKTYEKVSIHMEYEDFYQDASINIMKAINSYDSSKDASIKTYIINTIVLKRSGSEHNRIEREKRWKKRGEFSGISSLNTKVSDDGDSKELIDFLKSKDKTGEQNLISQEYLEMIKENKFRLRDRFHKIFCKIFFDKIETKDIAKEFNTSRQSILNIYNESFSHIVKKIKYIEFNIKRGNFSYKTRLHKGDKFICLNCGKRKKVKLNSLSNRFCGKECFVEYANDHPEKEVGFWCKGHKSFNKGMKQEDFLSKQGIINSSKTRFKKGRTPHNSYIKVGDIKIVKEGKKRIKSQYIKIAMPNKYERLGVYNWKKAGKIKPPKHIIIYKNGDTLDADISNLDCISMKDNLKRNILLAKSKIPENMIGTVEVMKILNKSQMQIKTMVKNGIIKSKKISGRLYYEKKDILKEIK